MRAIHEHPRNPLKTLDLHSFSQEFNYWYLKPRFRLALCWTSTPLARRSRTMSAVTSVNTNANLWPCCRLRPANPVPCHIPLGHLAPQKLKAIQDNMIQYYTWHWKSMVPTPIEGEGETKATFRIPCLFFFENVG